MIITTILSLLCKLYNILKDEITAEIHNEYIALWPTALGK